MAVRFHIPSEITAYHKASNGIERGNLLTWQQDVRGGIAGAPIDFGATIGTRNVLSATLGPFGPAALIGVSSLAGVLFYFTRRGRKRRSGRRSGPPDPPADDSNFLNYDPGASAN